MDGMSVFQGIGSINIGDNDQQRAEEEDANEDRARRNEEVSDEKCLLKICSFEFVLVGR